MTVLVAVPGSVVTVLQLNSEDRLCEVSRAKVQLADPLLDGQGTEDVEPGAGRHLVRVLECKD